MAVVSKFNQGHGTNSIKVKGKNGRSAVDTFKIGSKIVGITETRQKSYDIAKFAETHLVCHQDG